MVAETPTTFGALLRRHRLAAGLTQEQLAERAGLSVFGIQKLERGTTHPYRDTAARLTEALELAPDEAERFRAAVEPVRRRGTSPREVPGVERNHNLPVALTSFIGREQELAAIPPRLRAARLLTLTGVGGSGKTRLAIELARGLSAEYRDGVWLVELAQVMDPALVPHRLAAVLRVQEAADRPLEQVLADALRDSQVLFVVDNCEHVLDACALLIDFLLRECQAIQVLATSRELIGVPGEVTWPVSPLAAPNPHLPGSLADIERSPAVRLFVERASAVDPSFGLEPENAEVVAQICRRLDGMPLALELAAARLDALTPDELASRLDQRFALLAGGNRVAQPRQQTLSATIDWSFVLLSATQQRVFERLSVFANGWTLEAAEAACAGDGINAPDVLDAVLQLVRKTLVVRMDARHGTARYGLLETLRQYAWDKLEQREAELPATRQRHAAYYSALVTRLEPVATKLLPSSADALGGPVMETLDDAHDNLQLALKWWLDTRRAAEGLALISGLGTLWHWVGFPVAGRRWAEAILDLAASPTDSAPVPAAEHAQALMFASYGARLQGDFARSRSYSEASVALLRGLNDAARLGVALSNLTGDHLASGEFEQEQVDALAREAVAVARTTDDPFALSNGLLVNGLAARARGEHDLAASLLRESVATAETIEHPSNRPLGVVRPLLYLGRVELERGAVDTATALFEDAMAAMRDSRITGDNLGFCLAWMAAATARTGDLVRAACLYGAAEAQLRRAGVRLYPLDQQTHDVSVRAVQAQLGQDAFAHAWDAGYAMDVAGVFAFVLDEPA